MDGFTAGLSQVSADRSAAECAEACSTSAGDAGRSGSAGYWTESQRPLAGLVLVLPLLLMYEAGIRMLSDARADTLRNGADYWMRQVLASVGLPSSVLLPSALLIILMVLHAVRRDPWTLRPSTPLKMLIESSWLAIPLVLIGQLHHLLFRAGSVVSMQVSGAPGDGGQLAVALSFVGAGIYEELLFRLLALPAGWVLFRILGCGRLSAAWLSALFTAFAFALAHHVGPAGEPISLFAVSFRTVAGVYFAAVFLKRGIGVTVGSHTAYDLLVGIVLSRPIS